MKTLFADTSYFLAFLSEKDQYHDRAMAWSRSLRTAVLTTEYVVVEVGNSLTKRGDRSVFVEFYRALRQAKLTEVVPAATALQDQGLKLFEERSDKEWSLTDCISFVVMTDRGIYEALSADRDFEEAGFRALLCHEPEA